ncbi:hypothetical protein MBLNU13_g02837t2 [Cladosporium sp. NU13]
MLSRSNTTTSDRARRARSIASTQAARQRSSATSDPFVIRQQAEMAATLAYRSSQPVERLACPDYRPAPPMLQRRRSQVTGRSEGSHLEDARLGRRRSTTLRDGKITPMARQRPHTEYMPTTQKENEILTKRVTTAQSHPATEPAARNESLGPIASSHHRTSPFAYSNGSPAARTVSATPGLRSSTTTQTPRHTDKSYDDGISVTYTEPQSYTSRINAESQNHSGVSIRETQTDEEIIALARERRMQESQQQKIRERKSFFGSLPMLQKRNPPSEPPGITYDSSLPPFNYANDSLLAPLPPPHDAAPPMSSLKPSVRSDRKTRAFSTSVKGQFKRLLRKASRAPSGLVTQHTEVEVHGDFVLDEGDSVGLRASSTLTDPFIAHDSPKTVRQTIGHLSRFANNPSVTSVDGESAADRSRVTSWTNSTTAGTTSTRANTASTSVADEHGRIICEGTDPALRKKGSFFGRAVANRLRKPPSRADLKSSKESQALFTALRDRILPQDENPIKEESASSIASRTSSALSTLPSQKRLASLTPSINGQPLTLRTVSPDSNPFQIQAMSPLVEASPEHDSAHDTADGQTPTAKHYRSKGEPIALQAEPPSPERIARRVQQSQARWKGALHATSAASDGKITSAYDDDNPYELPSLSHNPYADQDTDTGGLPKHTRVGAPAVVTRENLLSPSVYSRATDGASPHPVTPEQNGTRITVTSREIKRYDISPPKNRAVAAQPPIQASGDWRKWLSEEMTSLTSQKEVDSLDAPRNPGTSTTTSTSEFTGRNRAATNGSGSQRRGSDTPSSGPISKKRGRLRASSRRSSYMNERYPMMESSENSSRRTSRKCSMASNAGTDTERSLQIPSSDDSQHSVNDTMILSKSDASKVLPKCNSAANVESLPDSKASSTSNA